jgi:hypothetical protein
VAGWKHTDGPSAVQVAEETFALLRGPACWTLAWYYAGAVPFVLAAVLYVVDLSRHPYADLHVGPGALLLTGLFVWMRLWQALFCERMLHAVSGAPPAPYTARRLLRLAVRQAFAHAVGMVLLPVALLFLIPFGYVYATLQQFTVLENGAEASIRPALRESRQLSYLWARQNHYFIWLLSPYLFLLNAGLYLGGFAALRAFTPDFSAPMLLGAATLWGVVLSLASPVGLIVLMNTAMLLLAAPYLLDMLLGISTPFTDGSLTYGAPYYALCIGITYLILDPAAKTAYVLRVFYGQSRVSGADLRARFARLATRGAVALLAVCLVAAQPAGAQEAGVAPEALNAALDAELADWVYVWRDPVAQPLEDSNSRLVWLLREVSGSIRSATEWCLDALWDAYNAITDFFESFLPEESGASESERAAGVGAFGDWLRVLLLVLTVMLLALAATLLFQAWRRLRPETADTDEAALPTAELDLRDEATTADALAEDEWLRLARELRGRGELRLAVRALFLGMLAALAERGLIGVARGKSDLEYQRELARYGHEIPGLVESFGEGMRAYESVWYGTHESTEALFEAMVLHQQRMAGHG